MSGESDPPCQPEPFLYLGPHCPTLYYPSQAAVRPSFLVHKTLLQPHSVITPCPPVTTSGHTVSTIKSPTYRSSSLGLETTTPSTDVSDRRNVADSTYSPFSHDDNVRKRVRASNLVSKSTIPSLQPIMISSTANMKPSYPSFPSSLPWTREKTQSPLSARLPAAVKRKWADVTTFQTSSSNQEEILTPSPPVTSPEVKTKRFPVILKNRQFASRKRDQHKNVRESPVSSSQIYPNFTLDTYNNNVSSLFRPRLSVQSTGSAMVNKLVSRQGSEHTVATQTDWVLEPREEFIFVATSRIVCASEGQQEVEKDNQKIANKKNQNIQNYENLNIQNYGTLKIQNYENLKIQNYKNLKIQNFEDHEMWKNEYQKIQKKAVQKLRNDNERKIIGKQPGQDSQARRKLSSHKGQTIRNKEVVSFQQASKVENERLSKTWDKTEENLYMETQKKLEDSETQSSGAPALVRCDVMQEVVNTLGLDMGDMEDMEAGAPEELPATSFCFPGQENRKVDMEKVGGNSDLMILGHNSDTESDGANHEVGDFDLDVINGYDQSNNNILPWFDDFTLENFSMEQFDLGYIDSATPVSDCQEEEEKQFVYVVESPHARTGGEDSSRADDKDNNSATSEIVEHIIDQIISSVMSRSQLGQIEMKCSLSDLANEGVEGNPGQQETPIVEQTLEDIEQFLLDVKVEPPQMSEGATTSKIQASSGLKVSVGERSAWRSVTDQIVVRSPVSGLWLDSFSSTSAKKGSGEGQHSTPGIGRGGLMLTPKRFEQTERGEVGQLATPRGFKQFVDVGQSGGFRSQHEGDKQLRGGGVGQLGGSVVEQHVCGGRLEDQLVTPVRGTRMASEDSLVTPDCNILSSPALTRYDTF